ncbi:hypothetical protein I316_03099 [Kwoniella heveanensis BCC8398]|uniref:Uncharacterized protein n=1 Tax=Kwoniella heveanensis BCC8398 TaxID=1296120 RepID=A0A1B9GVL2_9TREE|nr:hypothetical protein I316_03099 [Kwoniella heveanensis BCC8398]
MPMAGSGEKKGRVVDSYLHSPSSIKYRVELYTAMCAPANHYNTSSSNRSSPYPFGRIRSQFPPLDPDIDADADLDLATAEADNEPLGVNPAHLEIQGTSAFAEAPGIGTTHTGTRTTSALEEIEHHRHLVSEPSVDWQYVSNDSYGLRGARDTINSLIGHLSLGVGERTSMNIAIQTAVGEALSRQASGTQRQSSQAHSSGEGPRQPFDATHTTTTAGRRQADHPSIADGHFGEPWAETPSVQGFRSNSDLRSVEHTGIQGAGSATSTGRRSAGLNMLRTEYHALVTRVVQAQLRIHARGEVGDDTPSGF